MTEMFLSGVNVDGYRGLSNVEVENLTKLNVFVGPNNAGKSAVLESIALASVEWTELADLLGFFLRQRTSGQPHYSAHSFVTTGMKEFMITGKGAFASQTHVSSNGSNLLARRNEEKESHLNLPSTGPSAPKRWDGQHLQFQPAAPENHFGSLEHDISALEREGGRELLHQAVRSAVPGLKDMRILMEGDQPVLYVEDETGLWPAYSGGEGFKRIVSLAARLSPRKKLCVLEEPDTYLHPSAIDQLAKMLLDATRDAPSPQVCISTHSKALVERIVAKVRTSSLENVAFFKLSRNPQEARCERIDGLAADRRLPMLLEELGF